MLRLMSDLLPALIASRDGQLRNFDLRWHDSAALVVVMATNGYPGGYGKGSVIGGLDAAGALRRGRNLPRRHEGRRRPHHGERRTRARRCGTGEIGRRGAGRAYAAVDRIDWPEGFCRRDIGYLAVEREESAVLANKDGVGLMPS